MAVVKFPWVGRFHFASASIRSSGLLPTAQICAGGVAGVVRGTVAAVSMGKLDFDEGSLSMYGLDDPLDGGESAVSPTADRARTRRVASAGGLHRPAGRQLIGGVADRRPRSNNARRQRACDSRGVFAARQAPGEHAFRVCRVIDEANGESPPLPPRLAPHSRLLAPPRASASPRTD